MCHNPIAKMGGTPLVSVNGVVITRQWLDLRARQLYATYGMTPSEEIFFKGMAGASLTNAQVSMTAIIMDSLIDEILLGQEGQKRGLLVDAAMVDAHRAQLPEQPPRAQLEKARITAAEFTQMDEELAAIAALTEALVQADLQDWNIDAQAYYDQNRPLFYREEAVDVQYRQVENVGEAQTLIAELADGADFGQLSQRKSAEQVSAIPCGLLIDVTRAQMIDVFAEVAFALPKGAYSPKPIRTDNGFFVLQVIEKRAAGLRDFAQVEQEILSQLTCKASAQAYDALRKRLRAEAIMIDL